MPRVDPPIAELVRSTAKHLAKLRPGQAIELRIPPYAAVQLGANQAPTHRRGTPGSVVEMDPETFLALVNADLTWQQGLASGRISATGAHSDLTDLFL